MGNPNDSQIVFNEANSSLLYTQANNFMIDILLSCNNSNLATIVDMHNYPPVPMTQKKCVGI